MTPSSRRRSGAKPVRLAERGLVTVLSQTFRALIHSRMRVGMERYAKEFPDADVVLFEPAQDDEVIFFANMFSYADRRTARRARLPPHAGGTRSAARTNSDRSSPATASNSTGTRSEARRRAASKPSQTGEVVG